MKTITAFAACVVLLISGCGDSSEESKSTAVETRPLSDFKSNKVDELDDKTKAGCVAYGKMAFAFAIDRDAGVPFSQQQRDIRAKAGSSPVADEMQSLANLIYNNPMGKGWSPDGAMKSMYFDCISRIEKTRAGAKTYSSKAEIAEAFTGFKTFNGKPLPNLLLEYGIRISSVEVTPAEYFKNEKDKPGDKLLLVILASKPNKPMPCRLKKWVSGDMLPMPEIMRRGDEFPLLRPDEDDPLIYWAATGKCSEAYSY